MLFLICWYILDFGEEGLDGCECLGLGLWSLNWGWKEIGIFEEFKLVFIWGVF